ncbi:MAG TPA: DinB family protein [Pyrinomonadaceae bacterium]|nr:DinB family protein [Pyrinomonadaceae bacterium]
MHRIKWTDRRFNFDFPAGLYPEVIERIRGTPARLEELLAGLSSETLTTQADGRWSMQENAGHLLDLESLVSQRIDEYLAGNSALHAADMSNRKTYEASHNNVPVTTILNAFRTARHDIVHRLERLDAGVFERAALHPRLNVQMRLVDMLFFQAEHDDYHLARISELKKLLWERP